MNVLIVSDSFKGCMTSSEANAQIENGILQADPSIQCEKFTISDGGEGMVEAFEQVFQAELLQAYAKDLYGKPIFVDWAYDAKTKTACIEAASVLGLTLYPLEERHVLDSSSYGLGILIKQVQKQREIKRLVIGLGGTGCNDGGMGLAASFGAVFYDRQHRILRPCTRNLKRIAFIDKRNFYFSHDCQLIAACDVTNYLLGTQGATYIFGRQKGLTPTNLMDVEYGMTVLRNKIDQTFHVDMNESPGSGAAGGIGGMLIGLFGATMQNGIEVLLEGGLKEKIAQAHLIFTGEGQSDAQSSCGKVVSQIGMMAQEYDKPVIVVSGALGRGYESLYKQGITALFSTADRAMSFQYALLQGPKNLCQEAYNLMRLIRTIQRSNLDD
ncbi:glycerate kinase [Allobaculum stercoricanis]|uniref:glycerate kinase family protein n=1 Tax=Allobaculum stercoricanis TaxID=174709 RepID=UPI0023F3A875|nr:glycerate kinase [Allobaculum stercoricanis]